MTVIFPLKISVLTEVCPVSHKCFCSHIQVMKSPHINTGKRESLSSSVSLYEVFGYFF